MKSTIYLFFLFIKVMGLVAISSLLHSQDINSFSDKEVSELLQAKSTFTNIPDYNGGIISYISPVSALEMNLENVCVEIENIGGMSISYFPISYEIDNGIFVTEVYTGTIPPLGTDQYCFTIMADVTPLDTYNICVFTSIPGDTIYTNNDTLCWTFVNDSLYYCTSTANYVGYEEIVEVGLGSFVNNSGPAFGSLYQDFSALNSLVMTPGVTYPIHVTSDFSPGNSTNYNCYIEVYIDWNHDGIWNQDTEEMVFSGSTSSSNTVYGTVTVPFTAYQGTHGMRVVFQEASSGLDVNPCGTYNWGETEDYTVTVIESSDHDVGVTEFLSPLTTLVLSENDVVSVEVVICNLGLLPQDTVEVVLSLDGNIIQTLLNTDSIYSFESDTIVFNNLTVPGGNFDLCAHTVLNSDTNAFNDAACNTYYAIPLFDIELDNLVSPESDCNLGQEDVTIELVNLGDAITNGFSVGYFHDAMISPVIETISDTFPEGDTMTYVFSTLVDLSVTTDAEFEFTVFCSYGSDPVQDNDTLRKSVFSGVSPPTPAAEDVHIWSGEMAVLHVSNLDSNLAYYWYDEDSVFLTIDTILTTPILYDTTNYFLRASYSSAGSVGIAEVCVGGIDFVEIQNYSSYTIDATGWVVAASNSYSNINSVNTNLWHLGMLVAGEVQYRTDSNTDNYWGSNLLWNPGSSSIYRSWVAIVDNYGTLVDFWCQGWTQTELASFSTTINGFSIDFSQGWLDNGLEMLSSNAERVIYDNNQSSDWLVTGVGSPGQPCGYLINVGGSGFGCQSPFLPVTIYVQYASYDGGVVAINSPVTGPNLSMEVVSVDIYNYGLNPISNFPVYYTVNAGTPVIETFTDIIQPGTTASYVFSDSISFLNYYSSYDICAGTEVIYDSLNSNDEFCVNLLNYGCPAITCGCGYPYGEINDPAVYSATVYSYASEWWEFEVPAPFEYSDVVISLCGSSFDTYLAVFYDCNQSFPTFSNDDACGLQSQINIPGILYPGTYHVKVYGYSSAFGSYQLSISGNISGPQTLLPLTGINIDCYGDSTGSILFDTASIGGTPPYSFNWSNGVTSSNLIDIPAGNYAVTVTDSQGWSASSVITLTEPDPILIATAVTDATAPGGTDGSIDITASGGVSPYQYAWDTGDSVSYLQNITHGLYFLTTVDNNGCSVTDTVEVGEVYHYDLKMLEIVSPEQYISFEYQTVTVKFQSNCPVAITDALLLIEVYADNVFSYQISESLMDSIVPNDTFLVTFNQTVYFNNYQNIDYDICVSIHSGFGVDTNSSNNNICKSIDYCTVMWPTINYGAINDPFITDSLILPGGSNYWSFTLDNDYKDVVISLCGSSFDTKLELWEGCCEQILLDSNDNFCGLQSQLAYNYLESGCYFVGITGQGSTTGDYRLEISGLPAALDWTFTSGPMFHQILIDTTTLVLINTLPADYGDYIGIFYDSSGTDACAGFIPWNSNSTNIIAFGDDTLTATKEGFSTGEEFKWKIWRHADQLAADATAIYNLSMPNTNSFTDSGVSALTSLESFILATQYIDLPLGWSLFSTYIDPFEPSIDSLCAPLVSEVTIVKDGIGHIYWPAYGIDLIGDIEMGQGYQIKLLSAQTLAITGMVMVPENTPLLLPQGWSMIAYLCQVIKPIDTVMSGIQNEIVIIKNYNGQVFWPQWGINTIINMYPGEGYHIKMNSQQTFTYPSNSISFSKNITRVPVPKYYKQLVPTGSNMTIGFHTTNLFNGDELGVFNQSCQLLGSAVIDGDFTSLTVWGDDELSPEPDGATTGDKLHVKCWNGSVETLLKLDWKEGDGLYMDNKIALAEIKFLSKKEEYELFQNNPNPFINETEFSYFLPKEVYIEFSILNINGQVIDILVSGIQVAGIHTIHYQINNLAPGSYFYKLENDEFRATRKLVVLE